MKQTVRKQVLIYWRLRSSRACNAAISSDLLKFSSELAAFFMPCIIPEQARLLTDFIH